MPIFKWLLGEDAPPPSDGVLRNCAACESADITLIADKAYHCSACGHEGGPGLGAVIEQRTLEGALCLDREALHERVLHGLQEAQVTLHTRTSTTTEYDGIDLLRSQPPVAYALRCEEHPSDVALNQRKLLHTQALHQMQTARILLTALVGNGAWQLERVLKQMDAMGSTTADIQKCLDYCIPRVQQWEYVPLTGLMPASGT